MRYSAKLRERQVEDVTRLASDFLGEPGQAVVLELSFEYWLSKNVVFEERRGLHLPSPVERFDTGAKGHDQAVGLERYRVELDGQPVKIVKVHDPFEAVYPCSAESLWIFPRAHYVRLYRLVRRQFRNRTRRTDIAPIMLPEERTRLYDNTVGFLTRQEKLYAEYGVPRKRGVLLAGEPGNGKTMACRWLLAECQRRGLLWRTVSPEDFDSARSSCDTAVLFHLPAPGFVLFDDFDLGMRNRDEVGHSRDHSALLAGLDGVQQNEGVVFLFTTNSKLTDLDPAFLRRGRIDQVFQFRRPAAELRERFVREAWHADIVAQLNVPHVVKTTEGLSFAELAELKKLLVLRFLDTNSWEWEWAWTQFQLNRVELATARPIGFAHYHAPGRHAESGADISAQHGEARE